MTMMLPLLTLAVLLALAGAMPPRNSHQFIDQLAEAAQAPRGPPICLFCDECAASCHQQSGDSNICLRTKCSFCLNRNCPGFGGSLSIQEDGDEEATSAEWFCPMGPLGPPLGPPCFPLKRVAATTEQDAAGVEYCIPFPPSPFPQPPMPYPYPPNCLPLKRLAAATASSQEKATAQLCIPFPLPIPFTCIPVTGQVVSSQDMWSPWGPGPITGQVVNTQQRPVTGQVVNTQRGW